jgi:glycosyltransferase involved in cell wall biosynthesis
VFLCTEDWYFWSHRMPVARAVRDAGFHVIVATRVQAHGERLAAEGLDVRPLAWRRKGDGVRGSLRAILAIWRLYRRERPQLVHHIALKAVTFGAIAAFLAGVPRQVNAIAGLGFIFVSSSLRSRLMRLGILGALRLFVDRAGSHVVTQNPDDAEELIRRRVVRSGRLSVIRGSGVDVERFRPLPEPAGPVVVAMVARMLRHKGIEIFVQAARRLRARGLDIQLRLVGPLDPDSPASLLEEELRSWMQPGLIEWLGPVEDVTEVWRAAHIAAFPSIYREGVPLALLEAAACARPIVSSDAPGCREVVVPEVNGLLVRQHDAVGLADAIERLARDPALRARMGREGRQRAERCFRKELIVEQTLGVYSRLLGRPVLAEPSARGTDRFAAAPLLPTSSP